MLTLATHNSPSPSIATFNMAHTFGTSSKVEQLMLEASQLALDTTSFTKMTFDYPTSVDVYTIPWNEAWDALLHEAVEDSVCLSFSTKTSRAN